MKRTTIVISCTGNFDGDNCFTARSFQEALGMAGGRDIYVSGGENENIDIEWIAEEKRRYGQSDPYIFRGA